MGLGQSGVVISCGTDNPGGPTRSISTSVTDMKKNCSCGAMTPQVDRISDKYFPKHHVNYYLKKMLDK